MGPRVGAWCAVWMLGVGACGGDPASAPGTRARCEGDDCYGAARWSVDLEANADGDATVADDGRVFVTSGVEGARGLISARIVALDPDGSLLWDDAFSVQAYFGWPSRPVLFDGALFTTANDGLFKYSLDGERKYNALAPEGSVTGVNLALLAPAPAVGADGTVYWQFLAATRADGSLAWRDFVDPSTRCQSPVSARPDRLLIRVDDRVDAYNENGELAWSQEAPYGLRADDGCAMIPVGDDVVVTTWCEPDASFFACGHTVRMDLGTGFLLSHTPPPKAVPLTSTILVDTDGALVHFSQGPAGNPDYRASMWRVDANGAASAPASLPWFGIYGAALGDDGLFYVATDAGAAALDRGGEVVWRYEPEGTSGFNAGAPAIGGNGCVYYEAVHTREAFRVGRKLVCLESSATGLADTPWPRTTGGNHSANRRP